jgi:hypothetical protein
MEYYQFFSKKCVHFHNIFLCYQLMRLAAVFNKWYIYVFSPKFDRLNVCFVGLNQQKEMISQLVKEHAGKKGITEAIKATDQMNLVRRRGLNPRRRTAYLDFISSVR